MVSGTTGRRFPLLSVAPFPSSDHGGLAIRAVILRIRRPTLPTPYCCLLLPRGFRKSLEENEKAGRGGGDRTHELLSESPRVERRSFADSGVEEDQESEIAPRKEWSWQVDLNHRPRGPELDSRYSNFGGWQGSGKTQGAYAALRRWASHAAEEGSTGG